MTTAAVVTDSAGHQRPLRRDAQRNRERILEAARELFAERGLEVTLDEIAHRADLGVGTVYRRFPDRESLVEALFVQRIEEMVAAGKRALRTPDAFAGLVEYLTLLAQQQAEDLGLCDVLSSTAYGHDQVAHARDELVPVITRLLERAQAQGTVRDDLRPTDIPLLSIMICGAAQYTASIGSDVWRRYMTLLVDGLCPHRESTTELPRPALDIATLTQVMHCWVPPRR